MGRMEGCSSSGARMPRPAASHSATTVPSLSKGQRNGGPTCAGLFAALALPPRLLLPSPAFARPSATPADSLLQLCLAFQGLPAGDKYVGASPAAAAARDSLLTQHLDLVQAHSPGDGSNFPEEPAMRLVVARAVMWRVFGQEGKLGNLSTLAPLLSSFLGVKQAGTGASAAVAAAREKP